MMLFVAKRGCFAVLSAQQPFNWSHHGHTTNNNFDRNDWSKLMAYNYCLLIQENRFSIHSFYSSDENDFHGSKRPLATWTYIQRNSCLSLRFLTCFLMDMEEIDFLDPPCRPAGPMKPAPSVCLSVCLSVCNTKFSYFPPLDFSDFLHEVSLQ